MNPEDSARIDIDDLLHRAGFVIQDMAHFNREAALGVAVREFVMNNGSKADYLIFIEGKAMGIIEAKKAGLSLSGVENQSIRYANKVPSLETIFQIFLHSLNPISVIVNLKPLYRLKIPCVV